MLSRKSDRGATGLEYAAVILVAAAVVGTLFVVIPNQVTPSVTAGVCRLFGGGDGCRGGPGGPGPSGSPVPGGPSGGPSASTSPAGPVDPNELSPEDREYQDAKNGLNGADQEESAAQRDWDAFSLLNELKNIGLDFLFGDIMKCIEKPNIVDCLWAIVGLIPWGKIGKFIKAIPKLAKLADKFLTLKRRLDKARQSRKDAKDRLDRAIEACKRKKKPGNSFLPGTGVLLADGSHKPIERVRVGDLVWATDPATGRSGPRPVTALITGSGRKQLVDVTIDPDGQLGGPAGSLTTTANHPFWVNGTGPVGAAGTWQDAADLVFGDQLTTPTGRTPLVLATHTRTVAAQRVHNLTVADLHTYHVITAGQPILVHNENPVPEGCGPDEVEDIRPKPGDKPTKVANSNMPHAADRAVEREAFPDVQSARQALQDLGKKIERDGFPEGTIPDTAHADRVLVPLGDNHYAVYQIKKNGNAVLKTVLDKKDPGAGD